MPHKRSHNSIKGMDGILELLPSADIIRPSEGQVLLHAVQPKTGGLTLQPITARGLQ